MSLAQLISVGKGEAPADLILANARVVNVFTGEVKRNNVAILGDTIAGVGDYYQAKQTIDLEGRYLSPGFINGHTHIESSLLDVGQYARAVIPRGTVAVVTDLHEIANVCGLAGIDYVLDCARKLPLDLFLMASSCVPATSLETSGATIGVAEIRQLLKRKECLGLGEVMNFPGVIAGNRDILHKIEAAKGKVIDGHAPSVTGKNLSAYIGAGILSDHESVTLDEALEKLSQGMFILIREGSSEKNLAALLPMVTDKTYQRCIFVVDDRNCIDLLDDGDIDAVLRKAIKLGLDPVRAIQMATINTARYFRLSKMGALAAGYAANIIVLDNLSHLKADMVFYQGKLVARAGRPLFSLPETSGNRLTDTVNVKPFSREALAINSRGETMPVIEIVPGQIITRKRMTRLESVNGKVAVDKDRDILKLVVVERHKGSGNIGIGLVNGFDLKRGAIASSVAHDSHNIVVVGTNDEDIFCAIKEIERIKGGLVVTCDDKTLGELALPIAGLLSEEPLEIVAGKLRDLEKLAAELGTSLTSPFAALSFLSLPVIPELRVTDLGLVDVNSFQLIDK